MLLNLSLLGTLGLVSIAAAETINVKVGPGFTIVPGEITAAVGDEIEFEIYPGHSITEGDGFANPCQYKAGGFFSDFGDEEFVFTVAITDTSPKWIYCSQVTHCQGGMVAVINPSGDNTLADYIAAAEGAPPSTAPDAQVGGVTGGETSSSAAEPTETSTPSEPTETPATSEETTTTTESVETPTPSSNLTASITQPPVQTTNAAPSIFTGETVMMNALMGLIAVAAGWAGLL
jgi:hypothetical protein